MADLITPAELAPTPREPVLGSGTPETTAAWKALAESLLTDQPCVFHRNLEVAYASKPCVLPRPAEP